VTTALLHRKPGDGVLLLATAVVVPFAAVLLLQPIASLADQKIAGSCEWQSCSTQTCKSMICYCDPIRVPSQCLGNKLWRGTADGPSDIPSGRGTNFRNDSFEEANCGNVEVYDEECVWDGGLNKCLCPNPTNPAKWQQTAGQQARYECDPC
jgi:hypothetical protein